MNMVFKCFNYNIYDLLIEKIYFLNQKFGTKLFYYPKMIGGFQ